MLTYLSVSHILTYKCFLELKSKTASGMDDGENIGRVIILIKI